MAKSRRATRTPKPARKPAARTPAVRTPVPTKIRPAPKDPPDAVTTLPAIREATPERGFAARVKPPALPPPLPALRRAIFVDVENSSRAEHLSRVLDHLAIDRQDRRVEVIAVGNWRVIGADSARLLARRGAHLVHSAPSTGVKDWSDLRIAVSAGVWLGSARPGDLIEVISDDRAFDAVGDVAALLGVEYRRLSYRGLTGLPPSQEVLEQEAAVAREGRDGRSGRRRGGRHRGRGRGRSDPGGHGGPPRSAMPLRQPARPVEPARAHVERAHPDTGQQTAPHDELVEVVRELAERAPNGAVLIDTLARSLKERGFSRPPGSPRLITRLRRIRELTVSRTGMITLTGAGTPATESASDENGHDEEAPEMETAGVVAGDAEGNVREGGGAPPPARRRRRRRRGRRGGGGGRAPAAPAPER
jgi:hypothetical protein